MVLPIKNTCIQCGATESLRWWKCCPEHTTQQGSDVVCETCAGKLHPELVNFVTGLTEAVISPYMDVFGLGVKSFNSRKPRTIAPFQYEDIINAIDWNRVLIQAETLHLQSNNPPHVDNRFAYTTVCGQCIKSILLKTDE